MEIVIPGVTRKLALKHHFIPRLYVSADLPIPEWKEIHHMLQEMIWQVTDGPCITRNLKMYKELQQLKKFDCRPVYSLTSVYHISN